MPQLCPDYALTMPQLCLTIPPLYPLPNYVSAGYRVAKNSLLNIHLMIVCHGTAALVGHGFSSEFHILIQTNET